MLKLIDICSAETLHTCTNYKRFCNYSAWIKTLFEEKRNRKTYTTLRIHFEKIENNFVFPLFMCFKQDGLNSLVLDLDFPALRKNKNIDNFLNRCKYFNTWLMLDLNVWSYNCTKKRFIFNIIIIPNLTTYIKYYLVIFLIFL